MVTVTERDDLGAGPVLDEYFDFQVDGRGDVDTDSGVDEIAKDLSYNLQPLLMRYLGTIPGTTGDGNIEAVVQTSLQSDPRVRSAMNIDIQHDADGIAVSADIITAEGSFEFVEEVPG